MLKRGAKVFKQFFLDIFFPKHCLFCKKIFDVYVCDKCFRFIRIKSRQVYRNSFKLIESKEIYLDELYVLCEDNKFIMELIYKFKYNSILELKIYFERIFINFLDIEYFKNFDCFIPVPLHRRRLCERGFNQSLEFANILSKITQVPVYNDILVKTKNTKQQVGLNRLLRYKNLKDCFDLMNTEVIQGKNVLLVDDVFTTGATMFECAKLLRPFCKQVSGFVIVSKGF